MDAGNIQQGVEESAMLVETVMDMIVSGLTNGQIHGNFVTHEKLKLLNMPEFRIAELITEANEKLIDGADLEAGTDHKKTLLRYNFLYQRLVHVKDYKTAATIQEKIVKLKEIIRLQTAVFGNLKDTIFQGIFPANTLEDANLYFSTDEIRQQIISLTGAEGITNNEIYAWLIGEGYKYNRMNGLEGYWLMKEN